MDPIRSHSSCFDHHQQPRYTTDYKTPKLQLQDRLSSLPEHLLLLILSFLPTKYAVRTGILSKHWLYLWTSLPVLDFHSPDEQFLEDYGPMVNFIDRTLFHHEAPKIQKLSIKLIYEERYASNVDHWLRLATRKNVEELELNFRFVRDVCFYELTQFLLKNESLVRLKLNCCKIVLPLQGRMINWKNLESLSVAFMPLSDNDIREIVLGCPSLKFLELYRCEGFGSLVINSIGVRELVIDGHLSPDSILDISVPYVQSLSILGITRKIRIVNAASLIDAKLDFVPCSGGNSSYEMCLTLKEILGKLNHVRDLTLGSFCISVLSVFDTKEKVLPSLQSKCKCLSLTLDTVISKWVLPMLAGLLEISPQLEMLIIDMKCPYDGFASEELLDSHIFEGTNHFKCLPLRAKTIKIVDFGARKCEIELVQYLLKNARVLEKMVIFLSKHESRWESSQETLGIALKLLSFPRCSSDAVILVS